MLSRVLAGPFISRRIDHTNPRAGVCTCMYTRSLAVRSRGRCASSGYNARDSFFVGYCWSDSITIEHRQTGLCRDFVDEQRPADRLTVIPPFRGFRDGLAERYKCPSNCSSEARRWIGRIDWFIISHLNLLASSLLTRRANCASRSSIRLSG